MGDDNKAKKEAEAVAKKNKDNGVTFSRGRYRCSKTK